MTYLTSEIYSSPTGNTRVLGLLRADQIISSTPSPSLVMNTYPMNPVNPQHCRHQGRRPSTLRCPGQTHPHSKSIPRHLRVTSLTLDKYGEGPGVLAPQTIIQIL